MQQNGVVGNDCQWGNVPDDTQDDHNLSSKSNLNRKHLLYISRAHKSPSSLRRLATAPLELPQAEAAAILASSPFT